MPTPPLNELRMLSPIAWVKEERERQNAKWGEQNHNILRWLGILGEEFGEVSKVVEDVNYGKFASIEEYHRQLEYELLQTAAVAVSMVEAIRRGKGTEQPPYCNCYACVERGSLFPNRVESKEHGQETAKAG